MDFVRHINTALEKFPKAREGKSGLLQKACSEAVGLQRYIDFFGLKSHLPKAVKSALKLVADDTWRDELNLFVRKKAEREEYNKEHHEEIEQKKAKERERKFGAQITKWRNFEVRRPYTTTSYQRWNRNHNYPDLLRYNAQKQRIETSQGVEVPVESAHKFYRQIKVVILRGGCLTEDACAEKILDYSVREITAEYIRVECHMIKMIEVEEMAKQLGWEE